MRVGSQPAPRPRPFLPTLCQLFSFATARLGFWSGTKKETGQTAGDHTLRRRLLVESIGSWGSGVWLQLRDRRGRESLQTGRTRIAHRFKNPNSDVGHSGFRATSLRPGRDWTLCAEPRVKTREGISPKGKHTGARRIQACQASSEHAQSTLSL